MAAPRFRVLESAIATGTAQRPAGQEPVAHAVYAFVNIEVSGRGIATGRACAHLTEPDAGAGMAESRLESATRAAASYVSFRRRDTAFGHHLDRHRSLAHGDPGRERQAAFGCRLVDAAVLDALLRAHACSFFKGMSLNIAGIDNRLTPSLANESIAHFLGSRRKAGKWKPADALEDIAPRALEPLGASETPAASGAMARGTAARAVVPGVVVEDLAVVLVDVKAPPRDDRGADRGVGVYAAILEAAAAFPVDPSIDAAASFGPLGDEPLAVNQAYAVSDFLRRTPEAWVVSAGLRPARAASLVAPGFASDGIRTPDDLDWR